MRNIKLTIAYDGTSFKGWQVQKNGRTVQEEIEKAIKKVFGKKCTLYGAGRTDSGVHARGQVANFKTSSEMPITKVAVALSSLLPETISIQKAEEVKEDFHARFSAKKKRYQYSIHNSKRRDPFTERYAWGVSYSLDVPLMRKEAKVLEGRHDFKSFQASDKREGSTVRRINSIKINKKGSHITIDIEGDGFLYNMVRNITGTLVDIGRGYLAAGSMKRILGKKDRKEAGPTAPAKGLLLVSVKY